MSDIYDLCQIIHRGIGLSFEDLAEEIIAAGFHRDCTATDIADAILAAGWRPPARKIETVEELNAVSDMAIIRDCLGNVLEAAVHDQDGLIEWWATGSADDCYPVSLPATVLWEPEAGDE